MFFGRSAFFACFPQIVLWEIIALFSACIFAFCSRVFGRAFLLFFRIFFHSFSRNCLFALFLAFFAHFKLLGFHLFVLCFASILYLHFLFFWLPLCLPHLPVFPPNSFLLVRASFFAFSNWPFWHLVFFPIVSSLFPSFRFAVLFFQLF